MKNDHFSGLNKNSITEKEDVFKEFMFLHEKKILNFIKTLKKINVFF